MAAKKAVKSRGLADQVGRYLSAPYVRMIIPNSEEGGYLAEVLELPGCISEGETPEEAYRNLQDAMTGWIAASLDTDRPIPDPVGDREYSGHFPLRMSTELHRIAALRAMHEGVSLNQWIAAAIAEKVTKEDLADVLADKIVPKVAELISVKVSTEVSVHAGEIKTEATDYARLMRARLEPPFEDTTAGTHELLFASLASMLGDMPWSRTLLQPSLMSLTSRSHGAMGRSPSRLKGVN
jgi:antitoxin HicB